MSNIATEYVRRRCGIRSCLVGAPRGFIADGSVEAHISLQAKWGGGPSKGLASMGALLDGSCCGGRCEFYKYPRKCTPQMGLLREEAAPC